MVERHASPNTARIGSEISLFRQISHQRIVASAMDKPVLSNQLINPLSGQMRIVRGVSPICWMPYMLLKAAKPAILPISNTQRARRRTGYQRGTVELSAVTCRARLPPATEYNHRPSNMPMPAMVGTHKASSQAAKVPSKYPMGST